MALLPSPRAKTTACASGANGVSECEPISFNR